MDASGISHVFLFTVDNALALPADPSFVGFCASHAADVCFKVTPKVSPSESMGTVVMKSSGSKEEGAGPRGAHVLEYSDYDAAASAGLIEEGSEAGIHATGHLLMNLLSIDFLKRVVNDHIDELEYHVAHKKIATVGPDGLPFKPSTPNGIKLERFVFDAFPFASVVKAVEVQREEEFAPVKNPPGQGLPDSPDTARDLLLAHHTQLLSQAGVRTVVANGGEQDVGLVEISPLLSFSRGEQLREMFPTGELSKPDGRPFFVAHPSGRIVDKEENLIVQAHSSHGGDEL
jgi:UDP-N-acetylglucosamine/UDP-N-acetylgalactosamine diphosphorylase